MIITKKEQKDLINCITYIISDLSTIAEKSIDNSTISALGCILDGTQVLLHKINNAEIKEIELDRMY